MITTNLSSKRKMRNTLFIAFLIILALIVRLGFIQFIQRRGTVYISLSAANIRQNNKSKKRNYL